MEDMDQTLEMRILDMGLNHTNNNFLVVLRGCPLSLVGDAFPGPGYGRCPLDGETLLQDGTCLWDRICGDKYPRTGDASLGKTV
jgi:hypothetical protein